MRGESPPERGSRRGWHRRPLRWGLEFTILFLFWLALSGTLDLKFVTFGVLFSAMVVLLTRDLFFPRDPERFHAPPHYLSWLVRTGVRFLLYLPWLLYEILLANVHVAYLVLHPRIPIDPQLVTFETTLETEPAQVLLAQSITLAPGTIIVDIDRKGRFLVHALSARTRASLAEWSMQDKVASVFGQAKGQPQPVSIVTDPTEYQA
jgi:multicomponent Na+:H+ antiporter subunit E